jgi:hypothetical protein
MLRTATALIALLTAHAASASLVLADMTLRMTGFAYSYAGVSTNATSGTVGAGELAGQMTRNGATTSFLTYCTDLAQSFSWNTNYVYTEVATGTAHGFTTRQADLLGKLYTLAGQGVDTTDASAAFQLAVWEIVTETGSKLDILNGGFKLTSGASSSQRNQANNWLTAAADINAVSSFNATRLYSSTTQDFVVFTELPHGVSSDSNKVPEPASYGLVGIALLGVVATRRKA